MKQPSPPRDNHISTQTYDTVPAADYPTNQLQTSKTEDNLCLKPKEQVSDTSSSNERMVYLLILADIKACL